MAEAGRRGADRDASQSDDAADEGSRGSRLISKPGISGTLMTDPPWAALAIEDGIQVVSTDTDFARFREIDLFNPLAR